MRVRLGTVTRRRQSTNKQKIESLLSSTYPSTVDAPSETISHHAEPRASCRNFERLLTGHFALSMAAEPNCQYHVNPRLNTENDQRYLAHLELRKGFKLKTGEDQGDIATHCYSKTPHKFDLCVHSPLLRLSN